MTVYSGQKTVTTAGTAVALGSAAIAGILEVRALDTNSGAVALGNDGADDVTVDNGMRLLAGESVVFSYLDSLASLYLDAAEDGEGVCWNFLGTTPFSTPSKRIFTAAADTRVYTVPAESRTYTVEE